MRGDRAGKGQLSLSLNDKLVSENSKNLKMANQQTSEVLEQLKLYFLLHARFTFPWEWNSPSIKKQHNNFALGPRSP